MLRFEFVTGIRNAVNFGDFVVNVTGLFRNNFNLLTSVRIVGQTL
jgi:hypothetical protein